MCPVDPEFEDFVALMGLVALAVICFAIASQ